MHVVLVNPPQGVATGRKPNIDDRLYLFPPGLVYLAASCESAGHRTEILDFPALSWNLHDFSSWVEAATPDVLALSYCTPSLPYVTALAEATRRLSPHTVLIAGGPHVSFDCEDALRSGLADYVVHCEAEVSFPLLLEDISQRRTDPRAPGVSHLEGGTVITNPAAAFIADLDRLPMPAYHLLDMATYRRLLDRVAIAGMRGCPFGCTFCTITSLMGPQARVRSPELVVEELALLSRHGMNRISFVDPNFALFPDRLAELHELFERRKLDLEFGCQTRLLTLNDSTVTRLREMGCVAIFVGIESGSERVLTSLAKDTERKRRLDVYERLESVKEQGIEIIPSFIIGTPDETLEDIEATLALVDRVVNGLGLRSQTSGAGGNYQINMFGPFPGIDNQGLPVELPIEFAPAMPVCGTSHVGREDLRAIWHDVYEEYFPAHFESYLTLERAAERGRDLRFEAFAGLAR